MRTPVIVMACAMVILAVALAVAIAISQPQAHAQQRNGYHPFTVETSVKDKWYN